MDLYTQPGLSLLKKLKNLLVRSGINDIFNEKEIIGIKLHFGEDGNLGYLRPDYTKVIVDLLKEKKCSPFLTDSGTLYHGRRSNAVEHLQIASEHGYNFLSTGAPVVISDGLIGMDFKEIEVNLKHFKKIKIANGIYHSDGLIVFSHFKGHSGTGFGGAFKNLGMGAAPRPGKLEQHSDTVPFIKQDLCTSCGICLKYCSVNAISYNEQKKAVINTDQCIGCGECLAVCRWGAVKNKYDTAGEILIEKIAEYTYGMWKEKKEKMLFVNALIDIHPDCDCWDYNDVPLVEDVGFIASIDPVAIDQASYDLVQKAGKISSSAYFDKIKDQDSIFAGMTPEVDGTYLLKYAEKLNMGSRNYEIIKV